MCLTARNLEDINGIIGALPSARGSNVETELLRGRIGGSFDDLNRELMTLRREIGSAVAQCLDDN